MATRKTTRRATRPSRKPAKRVLRPWTREEMAFMRKYYRNYETSWVARQIGRTVYAVRYKAVDMNLKKARPSVWRGNTGSSNAFRPSQVRTSRKPMHRRTAKTRRTTRQTWQASSRRRVMRKSQTRRHRRSR